MILVDKVGDMIINQYRYSYEYKEIVKVSDKSW